MKISEIFTKSVARAIAQRPIENRELPMFAIRDIKANEYMAPFTMGTEVHAVRHFKTEINRQAPDNMAYLYPEDYELWYVGTFNTGTGETKREKELIATALQLKT